MRDAIRSRQTIDGQLDVSLFDVFWDLGCSDFALEVMAGQGLLMDDIQELPVTLEALRDRIDEHGSYASFVRENLDAIQEFYRGHRHTGNRRALPALTAKPSKTLPLPAVGAAPADDTSNTMPVPYTGRFAPVQRIDDPNLGNLRSLDAVVLHTGESRSLEIDLDEVTRLEPLRMLKGIFSGSSVEIERWWELRELRVLRDELDGYLRQLYQHYATMARSRANFYQQLFDTSQRWDVEARRIDALLDENPFSDRPWQLCATAMLEEARAVSRQLAYRSKANVEQTIELIHSHARRADTAMAGYLVYLNHHAFFAGRSEEIAEHIRRIETQTYRIQQELRDLNQKRVI